jgi:PAS domain S-box-containing protein
MWLRPPRTRLLQAMGKARSPLSIPGAERIFEYRFEELLGRKLTALMPGYLRHVVRAPLKTYVTTSYRQLEYWECIQLTGLKKSGRETPVELSVSSFTSEDQDVFTCFVRDITERNRAEGSRV